MKYEKIVKAKFIERENRFVAKVLTEDVCRVHVKNTGRCSELLVPGATVYLEDHIDKMGNRKMRYSLVAVEKMLKNGEKLLINMDSQAPNKVVYEALVDGALNLPGIKTLYKVYPEKFYVNSRFDFYIETNSDNKGAFIEVKGVTLEEDGFARFPDAPTERGIKHINELCDAIDDGYEAYIIFVIQMKKMHTFGPNYETHPEFGEALAKAQKKGVHILAYDCIATEDSLTLDQKIKVCLDR